jgi:hypothetical protein
MRKLGTGLRKGDQKGLGRMGVLNGGFCILCVQASSVLVTLDVSSGWIDTLTYGGCSDSSCTYCTLV